MEHISDPSIVTGMRESGGIRAGKHWDHTWVCHLCCDVVWAWLVWCISTISVTSRQSPGTSVPGTSLFLSHPITTPGPFKVPIPTLPPVISHRIHFHNTLHLLLSDSGFVWISQDCTFHSFSWPNNILLYGCTNFCSIIHQLMDTFVDSNYWLWTTVLWTSEDKF